MMMTSEESKRSECAAQQKEQSENSSEPLTAEAKGEELYELVEKIGVAMMTTRGYDGALESRPMQTQKRDRIADLWFVSDLRSVKVAELEANPAVNLSYCGVASKGSGAAEWASISGRVRVSTDRAEISRLYRPEWKEWLFGGECEDGEATVGSVKGGPEDERLCLLLVTIESAKYSRGAAKSGGLLAAARGLFGRKRAAEKDAVHEEQLSVVEARAVAAATRARWEAEAAAEKAKAADAKDATKAAAENAKESVKDAGSAAAAKAADAKDATKAAATAAAAKVGEVGARAAEATKDAAATATAKAGEVAGRVVDATKEATARAASAVSGAAAVAAEKAGEAKEAVKDAAASAKEVAGDAARATKDAAATAAAKVGEVGSRAAEATKDAAVTAKDATKEAAGRLAAKAADVKEGVKDAASRAKEATKEAAAEAKEGVKDAAADAKQRADAAADAKQRADAAAAEARLSAAFAAGPSMGTTSGADRRRTVLEVEVPKSSNVHVGVEAARVGGHETSVSVDAPRGAAVHVSKVGEFGTASLSGKEVGVGALHGGGTPPQSRANLLAAESQRNSPSRY